MIRGIEFSTSGTYPSLTQYITNGQTDVMIKVHTVGGHNLPGSDINTDGCNKLRTERIHTCLINFIKNMYIK